MAPGMMLTELPPISDEIQQRLAVTHAAREVALAESRRIIRLSATCIRAVHRGDFDVGERLAVEVRQRGRELANQLREQPGVYWSGYVLDAQKELAEACIFLGLVRGDGLPSPRELGVEDSAYLNGLGEAAGELRRYALDRLRLADMGRAEWALDAMDEVYSLLVTIDLPDAVTGGLRRTTDMVRGVLERTRGDVTLAGRQRVLEQALRAIAGGSPSAWTEEAVSPRSRPYVERQTT